VDAGLNEQFVDTMFRLRRLHMNGLNHSGANMKEIVAMMKVAECDTDSNQNIFFDELGEKLWISKPAISQMFNSLEERGLMTREIDKNDRRKVRLSLTAEGKTFLKERQRHMQEMVEKIFDRFGEEDLRKLLELFNRFGDITEELKNEMLLKGDDQLD